MKFGVLGTIEVHDGSAPVRLPAGRPRRLLAALLSRRGELVSVPDLVDALWPGDPPQTAAKTLQIYIHRLRRALGDPHRIVRHPGGYAIAIGEHDLDAHQLTDLIGQARLARTTGDLELAANVFEQASALWRGKPYADIVDCPFLQPEVERLLGYRIQLAEERAVVGLECGRHAELIPELAAAAAEHPYRERLCALLMHALYRCGYPADALQAYQRLRARLAEDLGLDPGPELVQLQTSILRNEVPARIAFPGGQTAAAASPNTPRQLPAAVPQFVGRLAELRQLTGLVDAVATTGGTVVISAIDGSGGIGKTALALHWAHQIAPQFPDGQLYVNLRGFDHTGTPMTPAEAIRGFLDAFAIPPKQIPVGLDAQSALYRSLLSGRRILVVLDNARDASQLRPLLPGSAACLVVVTSRNRLTGLIAAQGAHPITLNLLTTSEAHELLARRIGDGPVMAEPKAVNDIIEGCARLPLALAVVAARAVTQPELKLHQLAEQLHRASGSLDALTGQDPTTDLRTVFSWSYHQLTTAAARLFRMLSLHPGPDISTPAAASLAGIPVQQVQPLLTELTGAHLLAEHTPGRYTFHDLLRAYSTELAAIEETDFDRLGALHRTLDHYLHTSHKATFLLDPLREPIAMPSCRSGVIPEDLVDRDHAQAWFTTEHPVLKAAIRRADDAGIDAHTWCLGWTLRTSLGLSGRWHELAYTQGLALDAARRQNDQRGQAYAHAGLASARVKLGNYSDARIHLNHALELYKQLRDYFWQANTQLFLGVVADQQNQPARALQFARQALSMFKTAGHLSGQARTLNNIGWYHTKAGEHQQAIARCSEALAMHQELRDRHGEAATCDSLGHAHHHLGDHARAVACYQRALDLYREFGDRYNEADVLNHLGEAHRAAGHLGLAHNAWKQALTILDDLDCPDADQVRARLNDLDHTPDSSEGAMQA